jgi:Domain of unknown function (DUF4136)
MRMRFIIPTLLVASVALGSAAAYAETNSYTAKGYNFGALKTFDFKAQRRISRDPIANNKIWGDQIREEITNQLRARGFERKAGSPDFYVAYYVGLKQKYDYSYMDYGFPGFWGPRRFRHAWGWGGGVDVWSIPYTDSTLVVDIIDARTNDLVWRGYDTNTIDMKKPDKRLDKAVDSLVKKFLKETSPQSTR